MDIKNLMLRTNANVRDSITSKEYKHSKNRKNHRNVSQVSIGKMLSCLDMNPNKRAKSLIGQGNSVAFFCQMDNLLIG